MALSLLIGATFGMWIYVIGTSLYLIATDDWFLNTWLGKAFTKAWSLIRETINTILPPYKR